MKSKVAFGIALVMILSASVVMITDLTDKDETNLSAAINMDGIDYEDMGGNRLRVTGASSDIVSANLNDKNIGGKNYEVVEISNYAFQDCTSLHTLNMPNVVTIGGRAFMNCSSLKTADMPNVVTIGNTAFEICYSLQTVDMPNVETIGNNAFLNCGSLKTTDMPNVVTIGDRAFMNCSSLQTVSEMNKVETIGSGAFTNTNITSLTLPNKFTFSEGLLTEGTRAISYTTGTECVIPLDVEIIGDNAFSGCKSLQTIDLSNVKTIGYRAFFKCNSLVSVKGTEIQTIDREAFQDCISLETIDLSNVVTIGNEAFNNCNSLQTLDLSNVVTIGNSAFYNCNSLQTLDLSNVVTIGVDAFKNCAALTDIIGTSANIKQIFNMEGVDLVNAYFTDSKPNDFDAVTFDDVNLFRHVTDTSWVDETDVRPFCYVNYYDDDTLLASVLTDCITPSKEVLDGYDDAIWMTSDGNEYDFISELTDDIDLFAEFPEPEPNPGPDPQPEPEPEPPIEDEPKLKVSFKGYSEEVIIAVMIVSLIGILGVAVMRD